MSVFAAPVPVWGSRPRWFPANPLAQIRVFLCEFPPAVSSFVVTEHAGVLAPVGESVIRAGSAISIPAHVWVGATILVADAMITESVAQIGLPDRLAIFEPRVLHTAFIWKLLAAAKGPPVLADVVLGSCRAECNILASCLGEGRTWLCPHRTPCSRGSGCAQAHCTHRSPCRGTLGNRRTVARRV